jgi:hypothetical protein
VDHGRGARRDAADRHAIARGRYQADRRYTGLPRSIAELGAEPVAGTPAEAKAFVKEEAAKWQRVIAQTGVRVD